MEGIVSITCVLRSSSSARINGGFSANWNLHDSRTRQAQDKIGETIKRRRRFAE
jgi:hypothetical protein